MVRDELFPLALIVPQLLLPTIGRNCTGFSAVPWTSITAASCAAMEIPFVMWTTTPASTMRVRPLGTVTAERTKYGLCAAVQTVLLDSVPPTFVARDKGPRLKVSNSTTPLAKVRIG